MAKVQAQVKTCGYKSLGDKQTVPFYCASMFRPCIDLHEGKVKQIVGGSLSADAAGLRTNFVAAQPASWFAELYRRDGLTGGHVIMLGPGNEEAARDALAAFPGWLSIPRATS